MARIRALKPEAFESETLAEISVSAERTFFGMTTQMDDRGRIADKAAQINGQLWSMRGSHTAGDLEAELAEMVGVDLVCRYVGCDGKRYLHAVKWDGHQKIDRPSKSRLPRCPFHQVKDDYCGRHEDDCPTPLASTRETLASPRTVENGHVEDSRGLRGPAGQPTTARKGRQGSQEPSTGPDLPIPESSRDTREDSMQDLGSRTLDLGSWIIDPPSAAAAAKPQRGTRIPDPFDVSADMVAWARQACPHVDGKRETEKFINYWRAKSGRDATKVEWPATWRNWMLNAAERTGRPSSPPNGHTPFRNPVNEDDYDKELRA
jgi:hypothetical protein